MVAPKEKVKESELKAKCFKRVKFIILQRMAVFKRYPCATYASVYLTQYLKRDASSNPGHDYGIWFVIPDYNGQSHSLSTPPVEDPWNSRVGPTKPQNQHGISGSGILYQVEFPMWAFPYYGIPEWVNRNSEVDRGKFTGISCPVVAPGVVNLSLAVSRSD